MRRNLKRGLIFTVVWALPAAMVIGWILSLFIGIGYRGHTAIAPIDSSMRVWNSGLVSGVVYVQLMDFDAQMYQSAAADAPIDPAGSADVTVVIGGPQWHAFTALPTYRTAPMVTFISTPLWPLVVLSLIPLAIYRLPAMKRRRRRKAGLCTNCGYDMQGQSDTSGVCPECGTAAG